MLLSAPQVWKDQLWNTNNCVASSWWRHKWPSQASKQFR